MAKPLKRVTGNTEAAVSQMSPFYNKMNCNFYNY